MKFINKFNNDNQSYSLKPLLIVLGLFMNVVALSQNNNPSIRVKIDNSEIIDVMRAGADVNIKIDGKIDEIAILAHRFFHRFLCLHLLSLIHI